MATEQNPPPWLAPEQALTRFVPPPVQVRATQADSRRFGFLMGGVGFLIDPDITSEVLDKLPAFPVPGTPNWLVGITNLRGNLLPLFDLAQLWNWPTRETPRPLLILDRGDQAVGLMVDRLPTLITPGEPLVTPPPLPRLLREHLKNAYTAEETLWLDYDHHGLFHAIAGQLG